MTRMLRTLIATAGTLLLALPVQAQRTTEQFIPLGRSPGVSNVSSVIGTLEAVDTTAMTARVIAAQDTVQVRFTRETHIWLDRSEQRMPNLVGSVADLAPGRTIEVKFIDPARRETAEWIKIAVPAGGPVL